jgi:hypothetical protein
MQARRERESFSRVRKRSFNIEAEPLGTDLLLRFNIRKCPFG